MIPLLSKISLFAVCSAQNLFFFFPPWYKYLLTAGKMDASTCAINPYFHFPGDLWLIGLAVLDMLLRLAGFLAVISIIVAGVSYMTAAGNAEKVTSARKRIVNSLVGLFIALTATGLVAFIGSKIGGNSTGAVPLPQTAANQSTINTVFSVFYITIGAIAVLLVVIAGLRYVLSQGDPTKVADAKRMIIYTLAGVMVTALAATIVKYVVQ